MASSSGMLQKRLYLGNVTGSMTEQGLLEFFNALMNERGFTVGDGDAIEASGVNAEKGFASLDVSGRTANP